MERHEDVEDMNTADAVTREVEDLLKQFLTNYDIALRNLADK